MTAIEEAFSARGIKKRWDCSSSFVALLLHHYVSTPNRASRPSFCTLTLELLIPYFGWMFGYLTHSESNLEY